MYDWRKWRFDNVFTGIIGGLILGIVLYAIFDTVFDLKAHVYLITIGGAFGGWLFGMRDHILRLPRRREEGNFEAGWIGDCAFGIAGGYVIFLLVPGSYDLADSWAAVKIIATAMLGGFGARAAVERSRRV